MHITKLYNPLLLAGKTKPVPCDLSTKQRDAVVMVTGPNSGGKTRLLQSIGLVQLLGQTGCFVTAEKATLPMLGGMFVSLIEEAKSDQPEGQLGMELMRIRRLFEELGFHPSYCLTNYVLGPTLPKVKKSRVWSFLYCPTSNRPYS
jgi:DNA mismatch repair protein MutS2